MVLPSESPTHRFWVKAGGAGAASLLILAFVLCFAPLFDCPDCQEWLKVATGPFPGCDRCKGRGSVSFIVKWCQRVPRPAAKAWTSDAGRPGEFSLMNPSRLSQIARAVLVANRAASNFLLPPSDRIQLLAAARPAPPGSP